MKKTFLICFLVSLVASAAELKEPVFRMTEPELLAVLKENGLNDKVTAWSARPPPCLRSRRF